MVTMVTDPVKQRTLLRDIRTRASPLSVPCFHPNHLVCILSVCVRRQGGVSKSHACLCEGHRPNIYLTIVSHTLLAELSQLKVNGCKSVRELYDLLFLRLKQEGARGIYFFHFVCPDFVATHNCHSLVQSPG